ncbi:hypothetical protein [Glycomyces tarimensis]
MVDDATYTPFGEIQTRRLNSSYNNKFAYQGYQYEETTRRLTRFTFDHETSMPTVADVRYSYDDAGNVLTIADLPADNTARWERQCGNGTGNQNGPGCGDCEHVTGGGQPEFDPDELVCYASRWDCDQAHPGGDYQWHGDYEEELREVKMSLTQEYDKYVGPYVESCVDNIVANENYGHVPQLVNDAGVLIGAGIGGYIGFAATGGLAAGAGAMAGAAVGLWGPSCADGLIEDHWS